MRTHISLHGSRLEDVDASLLKRMRRQLHFDNSQQVCDLLLCPLDGGRYAEILKQKMSLSPVTTRTKNYFSIMKDYY